ncbi:MAG: ImmA/IrrE family metallo-endopeptidase [Acidobacteria bacterium]|nr:ImmA/IrrE family metallo-endopeptidase [Acidobacteriota bacterium]
MFGIKDFEAICVSEGITFVEYKDHPDKGELAVHSDRSWIVLRAGLEPGERRWIAFHELGHYFLHVASHKFSRGTRGKMDREANFFATIALLPTNLLKADAESYSDGYYPKEFVKIRFEIFREFGI